MEAKCFTIRIFKFLTHQFHQTCIPSHPIPMTADIKNGSEQASKKASFFHDEDGTDDQPKFVVEDVTYESNGLKGIVNSPFVCGAALLASFGGLSFGYGAILTLYYEYLLANNDSQIKE